MPQVSTNLHLGMHAQGKKTRGLGVRLKSAFELVFSSGTTYGLEWGDPETVPPLGYARDHFLKPFLSPDATVLEIGPGGTVRSSAFQSKGGKGIPRILFFSRSWKGRIQ